MDNWKRYNKWYYYIVLIIAMPILINLMCLIPTGITVNNNDWIGFWGSYIGSIIGGIVTLVGVKATIDSSKNQQDATYKTLYRPILILNSDTIYRNLSYDELTFGFTNFQIQNETQYPAIEVKVKKDKELIKSTAYIKSKMSIASIDFSKNTKICIEYKDILNNEYTTEYEMFILNNNGYLKLIKI